MASRGVQAPGVSPGVSPSPLGMPLCRLRRISSKACDDRRRMYSEVLIGKALNILSLVGYFRRAVLVVHHKSSDRLDEVWGIRKLGS